jgi:hypothetical protein
LPSKLTLTCCIPLRNLNLNPQHVRLQFQHLILYLPILERCSGSGASSASSSDRVIEAACAGFGVFADLRGFRDDG